MVTFVRGWGLLAVRGLAVGEPVVAEPMEFGSAVAKGSGLDFRFPAPRVSWAWEVCLAFVAPL